MSESYDAFLGGKVHAYQPKDGFRAGTDTVLLAASICAKPGQEILEVGAGSGVGILCLCTRISGLKCFGVEILSANVKRANRNLSTAGVVGEVICDDAFSFQHEILKRQFDHVFMNPPFYAQKSNSVPEIEERRFALFTERSVKEWVSLGLKRVRAKGTMTIIFPTEGLADILSAIPTGNAVVIQPIATVEQSAPKRVIVSVQVQRNSPLDMRAALVLQTKNGEPTEEARRLTRDGGALDLYI